MAKRKKLELDLPYTTYSELARRLKAAGRRPTTAGGVKRAIEESQNPEIIAMALEYKAEYEAAEAQKQQAIQRMINAAY